MTGKGLRLLGSVISQGLFKNGAQSGYGNAYYTNDPDNALSYE